jgi:hypothetical protein
MAWSAVFRTFQAIFQAPSGLNPVAGSTVHFTKTHLGAPEGDLMNTSIKARVAALVAAAFVTFGVIDLIADYAYPTTPATLVASAGR